MNDTINRIIDLVKTLNQYRNAYYNESQPIVSDSEYDRLYDELKKYEASTGFILANSPTQSVGYIVKSNLNKVEHPIPLLSLDKTKSIDDLIKFSDNQDCLFMLKYDGLTVELIYEDGNLVQASTRGDGKTGEDITHNAFTFTNIPKRIPYKNHLRIVGEAIIRADDFNKVNDNLPVGEKPYANQRNLAAGSVRQLDSSVCAKRNIQWMLWDVLEGLDEITKNTRLSKMNYLTNNGFERQELFHCDFRNENMDSAKLQEAIEVLKCYAKEQDIPIDGLVMKYNDIEYSRQKGGTSHHNNDGIAFKFEDEIAETTLKEIEWSLGRTGQLTPVAIFDPVELNGTVVTRASVHNLTYIRNYDLNIGDKIEIYKANMIIPQILKNISADNRVSKGIQYPIICSECGCELSLEQINNTEVLYCRNQNCKGKKTELLSYFVSKPAMNIDGLSESTLSKFIELGYLNTYIDIYNLTQYESQITKLSGFGQRSYDNLIAAIENSKTTTLDRVINALGISNIGKTASKEISKLCNGDPNIFLDYLRSNYDWTCIDDFGQIMSDSIRDYFNNSSNMEQFITLLAYLKFPKQQSNKITDTQYSNKTVVVTGSFEHFTRETIHYKLEELGAKISGSVSKKTDYLIVGENAGSKLAKAKEAGVTIITEEEFLKSINN